MGGEVISQQAHFGRSRDQTTGSAVTLNLSIARLQIVRTTSAGLNIKLQSARQLKLGGPIGCVVNAGSNSFNLVDNSSNLLKVMAPNDMVTLALLDNSTAAGNWILVSGVAGFIGDPPIALHVYIFGGYNGGTTVLKRTTDYDPQLEAWTYRTSMPDLGSYTSMNYANGFTWSCAQYGSAIHLFGVDASGATLGEIQRNRIEYESDTFTLGTISPTITFNGGKCDVLGTSIFHFNGRSNSTTGHQRVTVEFSVPGDSYTTRATRSSTRAAQYPQARSIGTKIVLMHGGTSGTNYIDTYDVDTFTTRTSRPAPWAQYGAACSDGTVGYHYGGYTGSATLNNVYNYDDSTDSWTSMLNFPDTTQQAACASISSFNYILGGRVTNPTSPIDTVREHSRGADTYTTKPVIPSPDSGGLAGVARIAMLSSSTGVP